MNNGYIEVLAPEHPASRKSGWIYEHRLRAAEILGRPLKKEEAVHHVDENKTNNSLENLWVFATTGDHSRFHITGVAIKGEDGVYRCPPESARKLQKTNSCKECGVACVKTYCSSRCSQIANRVVPRPNREELSALIDSMSISSVGRRCGVNGNTVRKWANQYGIDWRSIRSAKRGSK